MSLMDWLSGFYGPEKNRFLRLGRTGLDRLWIRFFVAMILIGATLWLFVWR
jgi:hypothetical protein